MLPLVGITADLCSASGKAALGPLTYMVHNCCFFVGFFCLFVCGFLTPPANSYDDRRMTHALWVSQKDTCILFVTQSDLINGQTVIPSLFPHS